jgi:hypothetical protein
MPAAGIVYLLAEVRSLLSRDDERWERATRTRDLRRGSFAARTIPRRDTLQERGWSAAVPAHAGVGSGPTWVTGTPLAGGSVDIDVLGHDEIEAIAAELPGVENDGQAISLSDRLG